MVRPKKDKPVEELEEFNDEDEDNDIDEALAEDEEDDYPMLAKHPNKLKSKPENTGILVEDEGKDMDFAKKFETYEPKEEEQKVVAIPRVVSVETMLNELYDGQQEMKQAILEIYKVVSSLK